MAKSLLAQGDAHHLPLADRSVHTVVTSPPYFGLRAYHGVEPSLWPGGAYAPVPGASPITIPTWSGMLGNEPTVSLYIFHTLLWLREVKRVLRDDGVAWVVIGDSFAGGPSHAHEGLAHLGTQYRGGGHKQSSLTKPDRQTSGYAQGCLLGIPAQIMLAAMADGWVCRNDVVWSKKSPMPESISGWRWQPQRCTCLTSNRVYSGQQGYATQGHRETSHGGFTAQPATKPDPACPQCGGTGRLAATVLRKGSWRHTRSHETILMLTKGMSYFANSEAVRETASNGERFHGSYASGNPTQGRNGRIDVENSTAGRNPRSVVTPQSASLGLDHYAAFPPDLLRPLIQATCPERCCPQCGQGWAPSVTQRTIAPTYRATNKPIRFLSASAAGQGTNGTGESTLGMVQQTTIHALYPTCVHYCTCADAPCTCGKLPLTAYHAGLVLDPFAGSATTLLVSRALGRRAIGVELSGYYLREIARARLGLTDLDAWHHGSKATQETFHDLPLFAT